MNAALYEAFNIPELCEKSSWLGGITGDSGDEWENMAGRVVQFTRNRVEKELDTCPWDIVGSELCNMTTSMFTANFDLASSKGTENEVALNMCQARGCGNKPVSYTHLDVYKRQALSAKIDSDGRLGITPKKVTRLVLESVETLRENGILVKIYRSNGKRLISLRSAESADLPAVGKIDPIDPVGEPVSYTHLDVYKRQAPDSLFADRRLTHTSLTPSLILGSSAW